MNVLILSGAQACKLDVHAGKSYVAQFVRRLGGGKSSVQVAHYVVDMPEAMQLLPRLHLASYDLILLQFDLPLGWLPVRPISRLVMQGRLWLNGAKLLPLKMLREQLAQIAVQVRVCNRQVVLLSPLPHRRGLERSVLKLAQMVYEQESRQWQVPLFDVSSHLSGGDELFQTGSPTKLSAVAHEVLGSELHTFITEPTYTLWS